MNTASTPSFSLFDHQRDGHDGVVATLATVDRCKLLMACGSGKTRVGPAVAETLGARTVVVYLPSIALIRQTLLEWLSVSANILPLCVCSDSTVGDDADEAGITTAELQEEFAGVAITTDCETVRRVLAADRGDATLLVLCTYHSSDVVRDGLPDGFSFDLGLYDEAHRTAGKKGMFSASLTDEHTPIGKRVFMTATPKHISFRKRDKEGEGIVEFSMDDERVYGPVAYRLPLREAIRRKIVSDYRVVIAVVDDERIAQETLANKQILADGKMIDAESLAHAIAIRDAMERYGARKVLTFHNSVNEALSFTNHPLTAAELDIPLYHVNGKQSSALRAQILERYAAQPQSLISNARCLTEGVDVPEIDMVAFLHPKESRIDIIQAIGRALRRRRDGQEKIGYVLIPLYVSKIGGKEFEEALSASGYDTIWQVLQAIREHDEEVDEALREAARRRGKGEEATLDMLDVMGPALQLDVLRKTISTICIDSIGSSWETTLGMLQRYYAENGNLNFHYKHPLGKKLGYIRQLKRTGLLPADRVVALEALGINWSPIDCKWENTLQALAEYRAEHGNLNFPHNHPLGNRLNTIRKEYRKGKLPADRITSLENLGIVWNPMASKWPNTLQALADYRAEHGNLNFPHNHPLGNRLNTIRQEYRKGKLPADRITALENLGIVWNPMASKWADTLQALTTYHKEHGDIDIPRSNSLGNALHKFRNAFRKGELPADHIVALESLGIVWNPMDSKWADTLQALTAYHKEYGNLNIPQSHPLGEKLSGLRKASKIGKLPADRIAALETLGIVWNTLDSTWADTLQAFTAHHNEHGNLNIPQNHPFGIKLRTIRDAFRKGKLPPDRIAALEKLGIVWNTLDSTWENTLQALTEYRKQHGNLDIPQKLPLGSKLSNLRQRRKHNKLPPDRIAALEALGINWGKPRTTKSDK